MTPKFVVLEQSNPIRISQFFELFSWFLESTLRNSFKLPRFFKLQFLEFPDFSNIY